MKFTIDAATAVLSRSPDTLEALLAGLSADWIHQHEGPDSWSPYAVLGHLIHGEKTDWIPRTRIILSDAPEKRFEPFDRFAQMTADQRIPVEHLLAEFRQWRKHNLDALAAFQLTESDLDKEGIHPELGIITLRHMLSSWVVHDLGHIAQISRVMAKQYKTEVGPWTQYLSILG